MRNPKEINVVKVYMMKAKAAMCFNLLGKVSNLLANKNDLVEKQFQERELKAPHFFQEGPKCQESTYPKRKQHATTECASMQTMLVLKKIKTKSMMIGDTSHKEKLVNLALRDQ